MEMTGNIIRKELLTNITSLRFLLALAVSIALFVAGGFIFVSRYNQEMSEYSEKTNNNLARLNEASKNLSEVANYVQMIQRMPKLTRLFCSGFEKTLPNTFQTDVFKVEIPEVNNDMNFFISRFVDLDWMFVISLILSFMAILLTFDSLSGEKERGTLPLALSNSVPRDTVLLGKYLGAIITLAIPLLLGLLINLIIVNLSGLQFDSGQWLKIAAFMGLSILYLSIFLLLGMLVSSRSPKSSTSIVILLFIWVVLVILIPSTGRLIAEKFVRVPTRTEVDRMIHEAVTEIWNNSERYGKNAGSWAGNNLKVDWINPPARARLYNAVTDAKNRINEDYVNKMVEQVNLGRNTTKISPVTLYQTISEAVFGIGVPRFQSIFSQTARYKDVLKEFLIAEDKKDPESLHLLAWRHEVIFSQKPVDFNALPKFAESDISMKEAMKIAFWDLSALVIINILLFATIYVSFLRCDVRQR
jgi:ABC-type transport system involved in multi-copper enzyme maturation permease subunit